MDHRSWIWDAGEEHPFGGTGLKMTGADVSREMIRGRSENRTG